MPGSLPAHTAQSQHLLCSRTFYSFPVPTGWSVHFSLQLLQSDPRPTPELKWVL